ncbi:hypothetical protein CYMTET_53524 [Cymbomonas tetramitiformis]|uniref:Uncharacterized protein n=1 Tax=Cymbomonas tetramitiformis TaxID=36881 RepID=A0AAE0BH16_9CHLO|nr:hypothetical protein CYMTET_53524 [Cymbomonas tetramitiformis]
MISAGIQRHGDEQDNSIYTNMACGLMVNSLTALRANPVSSKQAPNSRPLFAKKRSSARAPRAAQRIVYAMEEAEVKATEAAPEAAAVPEGTIADISAPTDFQGLGYTSEDSAGQSNIFAVEPKAYVADDTNDSIGEGSSTFAVIGGVVASLAVVLAVVFGGTSTEVEDTLEAGESLKVLYERIAGEAAPF